MPAQSSLEALPTNGNYSQKYVVSEGKCDWNGHTTYQLPNCLDFWTEHFRLHFHGCSTLIVSFVDLFAAPHFPQAGATMPDALYCLECPKTCLNYSSKGRWCHSVRMRTLPLSSSRYSSLENLLYPPWKCVHYLSGMESQYFMQSLWYIWKLVAPGSSFRILTQLNFAIAIHRPTVTVRFDIRAFFHSIARLNNQFSYRAEGHVS